MSTVSVSKVSTKYFAAVLALASLAPAVQAQDSIFAARVNVPFAFNTVSGQHFAPGIYTIRMEGAATLVIRGHATSGLAMTHLANDSQRAKTGKALFTKYGDQYFLRAVWVMGNSSHLICNESKAEKQLQIADSKSPGDVLVALLGKAH